MNGFRVPTSYHINGDDELVSLHITGAVTLVDVYELCEAVMQDPNYRQDWPHLADLRGAKIDIRPGAMGPFVRYARTAHASGGGDTPIAVVFDGHEEDAFCAGVYRFTCALGSAELFDDYAHAMKWLLENGWQKQVGGHPAPPGDLLEPPNPRRHGADEHPEQIRT